MLIESVQLEGVGPFRERLEIGPLQSGLNILAQPNEWGKSTLVKALGRALFDRYRSEAEEIRQLRPAGSLLSPRIELVFSAGGQRFLLSKGFLDRKACELSRWQGNEWERTAESDRADQRLRELLGAPALEGRIAKPETWGFLRYLWGRQDAQPDWPDWSGPAGEATRNRLAAVPIDTLARAAEQALRARAEVLFTNTGRVKAGSPLAEALEERTRLTKEREETKARRAALEELQQRYSQLGAELPVLKRELEVRREESRRTRAEAEAAEKLEASSRMLEAEFNRLEERMLQLKRDQETLAGIQQSQTIAATERERIAKAREQILLEIPPLEGAVVRAQAAVSDLQERRAETEAKLQRQRGLLQVSQFREEEIRLRRQLERAKESLDQLRLLEDARSRLPRISAALLKKLRAAETELRETRVRLESAGLRVTLTPSAEAAIRYTVDGVSGEAAVPADGTRSLHAARMMSLELPGWGRIEIASGAVEATNLQSAALRCEAELKSALSEAAVASVADAEAAFEQAKTLDHQIKAERDTLRAHLGEWETIDALESALTRAVSAIEQQQELLRASPEELAASAASLRANEETFAAELDHLARAVKAAEVAVTEARTILENAARKREEHAAQLAAIEARERGLVDQRAMVEARHPLGIPAVLAEVQCEWVKAEARLLEARRQMPENAGKLPERSLRAARALADTEGEVQRVSTELQRVEVQIAERGGEGLYSREAELEERLEWIASEVRRMQTDGLATRLVAHLIQQQQASATRQVLGPLENRLTDVFAGLTGNRNRRVWFDETLQVRGIGPNESELVPFHDLSRGAREQLLLALRAAVALELSADEPQCLILDDVLVNTDAVRQENVLDYLQELAQRVQILLLTCHADRYRGVGHLVNARYGAQDKA